ncbi:hypothetical protein EGT07_15660 [Herbaspirillum sp. HC18]|nr:hypothetical protein EGT07_15660 [Herbaspirillum sp. HC18]
MSVQENRIPVAADDACEPEWVALNPLLSYCAKSFATPVSGGENVAAAQDSAKRCNPRTCVFGFRKF